MGAPEIPIDVAQDLRIHARKVLVLALLPVVFVQRADRFRGMRDVEKDMTASLAAQDLIGLDFDHQMRVRRGTHTTHELWS